jgi:hypothetical protein
LYRVRDCEIKIIIYEDQLGKADVDSKHFFGPGGWIRRELPSSSVGRISAAKWM